MHDTLHGHERTGRLVDLVFVQARAKRFVQDTFVPKLQGAPCQVTIHKHTTNCLQSLPAYTEQQDGNHLACARDCTHAKGCAGHAQRQVVQLPSQVEVAHTSGAVGEALCRRAKELDAQAVVMAR